MREELDRTAPRAMAVLDPVRVVLENFPDDHVEWLDVPNHPKDPTCGTRRVPLQRELLIERDDFMEEPSKQFHRLAPGQEVRLRYAYVIRCHAVIKDAAGTITELRCIYDPDSGGGRTATGARSRASSTGCHCTPR